MTMRSIKPTRVLAVAALALACCKHDGAATGAANSPSAPRSTSPAIGELLAAVPGNAIALGFIDLPEAPWSFVTGGGPFPLDEDTRKTLDKELREYISRLIGLDVSKLQHAVAFIAGPRPQGAVLVRTVSGMLKMPGGAEYEGGKLWVVDPDQQLSLAIRNDVVVFGPDATVREVLETQAGKRASVTTDNKPLVDWLRKNSSGAVLAFAAVMPKAMPIPPPVSGLERVALSINTNGIAAVVDGDDASISWLQAMSDQAFAKIAAEVQKAHDDAIAGRSPPPVGAMAIIGAAYAKSYTARIKPRRAGNRLSASLEIGGAGLGAGVFVVPLVGIVAAVAIPAFMDYMKRSKRTEAELHLNKIGKNAKRVYAETGKYPAGTTQLTPAKPCCGQPQNHCSAAPSLYANPTWQALDFQTDGPTRFQYSYSGSGDGQRFVAKAVGDLDCDGVTITYELTGTVSSGVPSVTLVPPDASSD